MVSEIKVAIIAARGRNGVIGADGDLPWRLRDDMAAFKRITMGKPVIMGRKTWESFPKRPLPGRCNIVLSRDWSYAADDARVYSGLAPAINAAKAVARRQGAGEVFVIGGAQIYAAALARTDRIYLTEVEADPDGDVVFPDFDEACWTEASSERFESGERNEFSFRLRRLERKP